MNRRVWAHTGVLAALTTLAIVSAATRVAAAAAWHWAGLAGTAAILVHLLTRRSRSGFLHHLGTASILLILFLCGPGVAVLAAGLSALVGGLVTDSLRTGADRNRLLFHVSLTTLSAFAAGSAFAAAGGRHGGDYGDPLAGVAAVAAYVVTGTLCLAGRKAARTGERFWTAFRQRFDSPLARAYLTFLVLTVPSAFLVVHNLRWLPVVVIFAALLQATFSQYYQMIRQADTRSKELEAVLNATRSAIALVTASGQIGMANREFASLCGLPPDRIQGRCLDEVLPPELLASLGKAGADEPLPVSVTAGGTTRNLWWYSAPVRRENGTVLGTVEVFTDVTALQETQARLTGMYAAMVRTLTAAIDARDEYTHGHSERVSRYAVELARRLGLDPADVERIRYAALLHDIGKLGIDDAILRKTGPLTPGERAVMMQHPAIGAEVLSQAPVLHDLIPGVRWHHEWVNGNGYPDGLRGDAIPLDARIISVADAFDAMTSHRSYRQALSPGEAIERLKAARGEQFDPRVVDALVAAWAEGTLGAGQDGPDRAAEPLCPPTDRPGGTALLPPVGGVRPAGQPGMRHLKSPPVPTGSRCDVV